MLHALQQSALMHRKRLVNTRFIGITGSNGKTIVKEWAHQLIESEKRAYRSFRSHNSQIGVALSVWKVRPEDAIAVIEAGISSIGEMGKLEATSTGYRLLHSSHQMHATDQTHIQYIR